MGAFDGERNAAVISTFMEFHSDASDTESYYDDLLIWNQGLSGVKNFIQISNFEGRITQCFVDKVENDSILDWLFGFDPNCVEADDNHCTPPNIGSILHALPNLTWTSCEDYKGVHSNVFELENWHVDAWNADLKVRYYWTDPDHWTGTSGTGVSIPVAVMFAGTAQTKENTTVPIDEIIEFQSFFEVKSGAEVFEPPADMVCEGRALDDRLPMIPNYYEYGSELIFHYKHDEHMHKVVSPHNNWYDQDMQVARLDYKPLVLDHANSGSL